MTSENEESISATEERRYPCTVGNVACERDSQYSYFRGSRFPVDKRICVKTWVTRSIEEYAKFDEDAFISDVCYQIPRNVPRRRVFNKYRWYEFENAYIVIGQNIKAKPPTRSFRDVFWDPCIRGYRLKIEKEYYHDYSRQRVARMSKRIRLFTKGMIFGSPSSDMLHIK